MKKLVAVLLVVIATIGCRQDEGQALELNMDPYLTIEVQMENKLSTG